MKNIRFNNLDAALLYSFPAPPSDLAKIVWYFTSTNRTYPPTFEQITNCLNKGMRVGIIREDGGLFVIDDIWYGKIHMADDSAGNEIEAMMEFQDGFVNVDFNETTDATCSLTEADYESMLAKLR